MCLDFFSNKQDLPTSTPYRVATPELVPDVSLQPVLEPNLLKSILHPTGESIRARQNDQLTQLQTQLMSTGNEDAPIQDSPIEPVETCVSSPIQTRWLNEHTVSAFLLDCIIEKAHETMTSSEIPEIELYCIQVTSA